MPDERQSVHPLDWARQWMPDYFPDDPADFHRELLSTLQAGTRLVARVAPRGHAKSTCVAFGYPLWCLAMETRRNIVLVTHEGSLARQFVSDIRDQLQSNEDLLVAYPHLRLQRGDIQRCDRVTVGNQTIQGKGTGASLRGTRVGPHRPDLIVCDDLEKDKHVRAAAQREALRHWLRRVAIPALAPHGQLVIVGSIIHHESLLAELRDRRRFPRWDYRVYRALEFTANEDGSARPQPLWPARWSYERLQEERARIGMTAFQQEYQANPVDANLQVFHRNWLRPYRKEELVPERLIPLMAVDPATGVAGGDFFALWAGAFDCQTGVLFTYELRLERLNVVHQIGRIAEAFDRYRPSRIGIETVGYQKALYDAVQDQGRRHGRFFPVVPLQTLANKRARIEGIAPLLEQGLLRMPEDLDDEVVRQFLHFPHARHDDAPDVCAMAVELVRALRGGPVEIVTRK